MFRGRASSMHRLGGSVLALIALCLPAAAQEHVGQYSQSDVETGFRLYGAHCSTCHGADGASVAGIDLGRGQFRRVSSDADLRLVIANGIAGTAMPPGRFGTGDMGALVAYVRSMRDYATRAVALGDPVRGQALFEGRGGCTSCHRVNGRGSLRGPDLSEIGAIRAPDVLEQSLVDPNAFVLPINREVRAATREGRVVTGRRLNEDTYTVQLVDEAGRLVSLDKADLAEYTIVRTSPMPAYGDRFTADELNDVVAYLHSLKGAR